MDRGGVQQHHRAADVSKPSLFAVYQNPALSAALTSNSLRPSASTFLFIISLFSASLLALLVSLYRYNCRYMSVYCRVMFFSCCVSSYSFNAFGTSSTFFSTHTELAAKVPFFCREICSVDVISPVDGDNVDQFMNIQVLPGLLTN